MNSDKCFDIVTYCSKTYIDAYDAHIVSWLNNTFAKNIYIYTDCDVENFKINDDRIIIKQLYDESEDWVESIGRKTKCILHYLEMAKSPYFAFIEIDCLITSDFSEVFNKDVDIAITRLFSTEAYTNATVTCGVWFAQVNDQIINFMKTWDELSSLYKDVFIGTCVGKIAYDQLSFTDLIRPMYVKRDMNILALDEHIYNCEHSNRTLMLEQIKQQRPKIIHMKGQRFRDEKYVQMIHNVLEGESDD